MLEAWHLPGLESEPTEWLESGTPGGARFRAPALSAAQAGAVAQAVRNSALEARSARTSEQVIESIAAAAAAVHFDQYRTSHQPRAIAGPSMAR